MKRRREWNDPPDFEQTCVEVIRKLPAPGNVTQLRSRLQSPFRFPPAMAEAVESRLLEAARRGGIHVWPPRRGRACFWWRSPEEVLEEALGEWLRAGPGLLKDAVRAVRGQMPGYKTKELEARCREVLRAMGERGQARIVEVSRTAVVCIGRCWMAGQVALKKPLEEMREAILEAVDGLASARGNYVSVLEARQSRPVMQVFDKAALALAREGKLVLGEYAGPRPVPDSERPAYVEAAEERYFIALARPFAGEGDDSD